jgi:hypothetical protein
MREVKGPRAMPGPKERPGHTKTRLEACQANRDPRRARRQYFRAIMVAGNLFYSISLLPGSTGTAQICIYSCGGGGSHKRARAGDRVRNNDRTPGKLLELIPELWNK